MFVTCAPWLVIRFIRKPRGMVCEFPIMAFRYYTNMISQASRTVAAGIFIVGLVLIGFGFMIYLLPKFFATLAAIVFSVFGVGCLATAVKIFLAQRRLDKLSSNDSQGYRRNVQIRTDEYYDI